MSFLAEAQKQKRLSDEVESSDGMTLLNVIAVGSTGFYVGTPVTATAALGTALGKMERRIRRSVEWEERNRAGKEAGDKASRKRGKGAQLRRRLRRQQQAINKWRQEQRPMQPGATRAEPQRLGCTRLLEQLGMAQVRRKTAERLAEKAAAELVRTEASEKELQKMLREKQVVDVDRLQLQLHEEKMKVRGAAGEVQRANAELKSMWEVLGSNEALHAGDQERWAAEKKQLAAKLKEAEAAAKQEAMVGSTAEENAGTARKAVARPPATGGMPPRQLDYGGEQPEEVTITIPDAPRAKDGTLKVRFEWDGRHIEATVAAIYKAGSKLRVTVPRRQVAKEAAEQEAVRRQVAREDAEHGAAQQGKMLAEDFISWDDMSDRWHEAMNELHELQRWMSARYPDAEDAWLARCGKGRKKSKSSVE